MNFEQNIIDHYEKINLSIPYDIKQTVKHRQKKYDKYKGYPSIKVYFNKKKKKIDFLKVKVYTKKSKLLT